MRNIRRLFLTSLVFLSIPLASCQKNSLYGTYTFEMGSKKGTHFGISLTLYETVATPQGLVSLDSENASRYSTYLAQDADLVQHPFEFSFENVSAISSSSSASTSDSSALTSDSSVLSSSAVSSSSESASSSAVASSTSSLDTSASTSEESSSEDVTDSGTSNLKIKAKGLWSFYADSTSSSVDTSNGNPLRIEFTSFQQTDVTTGQITEAAIYLPADFTKAIFDINLKGKTAAIKIPVSSTDLLNKVIAVLGGASPSELDTIHQVTIELTKQD